MPEHSHTADGPETCFGCKAAYWRERAHGVAVSYPYGQDVFHNTTNREQIAEMFAHAKRQGVEPEPVGYTHF